MQRLAIGMMAWSLLFQMAVADDTALMFEQQIRPIFRAHCFDCHGATDERKGQLDLRLVRFMMQGGESGPAITPGVPGESYLLDRLRNGEMPPGEKKLSAAEIALIEQWIAAGAKTIRPEPESIGPGVGISHEERSFWSFQPIRRPAVPELAAYPPAARVRTPIDALLLTANRDAPVVFAPDADRRTLVKRAYFDLIGLPPSPEELQRWLNDAGADWYDRLLTELFDSPHYGERWARHWLDIAGYADSDGYTTADAERPWIWKYRDWVIRALNADVPFDRFITEQLAGDELAGPQTGDLTPQQIELLTATGFLRLAADGTGSGADNADGRNQVIADTLKIIGTSLLGLSLQCAQCHDHRYDPIPQTDYFALRAVFEPALDWQAWKVPDARRVSLATAADRQKSAEVEAEAQQIAAERKQKETEYLQQALDKELMKFEEPLRTELREAYQTSGDKRTDAQKQLLAQNPSVNISPGVLYQYLPQAAEELKKYDQRITETRAKKPLEEFLAALIEPPNHTPVTKLFHRGDHQQPKQEIAPAGLSVLVPEGQSNSIPSDDPSLPTTGRRLALARWLTNRDNPLFARVIVNRIWMQHFGQGLVATPADFGKLGALPAHPELLDWLADEFVTQGWSLKKLHRVILSSTAWRSTAEFGAAAMEAPPAFRRTLRRLEAETIRDRMLAATGQLDRTVFGPPVKIAEDETGQVIVNGNQIRRSLYIQARRSRPVAMLQAFDAPVMETNCESRISSTVATQSLMLLNGEFILDQSAKLADRAAREGVPLTGNLLADLPTIPEIREFPWQYGYGVFNESGNVTGVFTPLTHWTGSQWQAGSQLPDPERGWVLLHASGGHPDLPERAVIRRWIAPETGTASVAGVLSHGSPNGNGVRGRIVLSRSGKVGEWTAHNNSVETPATTLDLQRGDTLDFITDSLGDHTSDSFTWPVTITLKVPGQSNQSFASAEQFRGPSDPPESIPGQIVRAWELALCRPPTHGELVRAMEFVQRQLITWRTLPTGVPAGRTGTRQALTNLCQALLSSNEFLYVD